MKGLRCLRERSSLLRTVWFDQPTLLFQRTAAGSSAGIQSQCARDSLCAKSPVDPQLWQGPCAARMLHSSPQGRVYGVSRTKLGVHGALNHGYYSTLKT